MSRRIHKSLVPLKILCHSTSSLPSLAIFLLFSTKKLVAKHSLPASLSSLDFRKACGSVWPLLVF